MDQFIRRRNAKWTSCHHKRSYRSLEPAPVKAVFSKNFGFHRSIDRAVNRLRRCLESKWRGRTACASPCLFREGISCGRDCEEVSVRRLDSVSKSSRARAEQHANSDRRLETYLDRTEACPICNWRDRSIADLDGMRLERNGRSAVAIASPLATYGPVPTHDDLARLRTRIDDAPLGPI